MRMFLNLQSLALPGDTLLYRHVRLHKNTQNTRQHTYTGHTSLATQSWGFLSTFHIPGVAPSTGRVSTARGRRGLAVAAAAALVVEV